MKPERCEDMLKKVFKGAFLLLAAATSAAAMADDLLDITRRQPVPYWEWQVSEHGELQIFIGDNTYTMTSRFSWPGMPEDCWNTIPGSKVEIVQDGAKVMVAFADEYYTLQRVIEPVGHRLMVKDTFTNISGEDIAIAFDNTVAASIVSEEDNILVAGSLDGYSGPETPAQNSSVFFEYPESSLGFLLEDDFYRLQAEIIKEDWGCAVENRSFGLAAGDSYTFEYSFYPTGKGDYWDFINRVRRDWNVNSRIDGNLIFCTCPHPQLASSMPEEIPHALVNFLGAKYIAATNYTWLGAPSAWGENNRAEQLERIKEGVVHAAEISPELVVMARIQTIFAAPLQEPEGPVPFADSVVVEADGKPRGRPEHDEEGNLKGYSHIHYPVIGNSYYDYLVSFIEDGLDAGAKAIYFDTFTYALWSLYGRWTYDRWDGYTIDIDEETWTIDRKKADLAVLVSDAQLEFKKMIEDRGAIMIFNNTAATRKQMSMLGDTLSFTESSYHQLPGARHVSHPVNLGYYPGYGFRGENWKTPEDLFENVMGNLDYGCLSYVYWLVGELPSAPTIYQRMYPITVKNIYAGCVEGEERIVTNRSGTYSFGNATAPLIYIYDANGVESTPTRSQARIRNIRGVSTVTLTLPEGGAAVLVKQTGMADALAEMQ